MKAILLIDHGSIRAEANNMLDCVAELVARLAGDGVIVEAAHMELAEPSIAQGLAACVERGATEVVAFPYMLSPGKHSTRDIPRLVAQAARAYPGVECSVVAAFGVHDKLARVVLERAGVFAPPAAEDAGCCTRPPPAPAGHCGEACRDSTTRASESVMTSEGSVEEAHQTRPEA